VFIISIKFDTKLKEILFPNESNSDYYLDTMLACAKFSPTKLTVARALHREYFVTAAKLSRNVPNPLSPLQDPSKR
jgi:hypothetical protein